MLKRPISLLDDPCSAATAAKRPAAQRKQNLYLVLADWEKGYSIRKVDVDAFDSDDSDDDMQQPEELFLEPPVARLEVVHGHSFGIVAHGTTIVAMKPRDESSPAAPAFDTATLAASVFPLADYRFDFDVPRMVSVAGKLFLFFCRRVCYLAAPPPQPSTKFRPDRPTTWAWTKIDSLSPFFCMCVHCYAVHPDGRTIFMSAERHAGSCPQGTFSFDTERLEWTRVGDWRLPFDGQTHYDAKMDAWVGLCRHDGGRGYLCSSDVVPVDAAAGEPTRTLPRWKLLEDQLFDAESPSHIGATLVYMGDSEFCVVESTWHKDEQSKVLEAKKRMRYVTPDRVVLSMTTFGLSCGDDGEELRLSSSRRRARDCKVFKQAHMPEPDPLCEPVAFWI